MNYLYGAEKEAVDIYGQMLKASRNDGLMLPFSEIRDFVMKYAHPQIKFKNSSCEKAYYEFIGLMAFVPFLNVPTVEGMPIFTAMYHADTGQKLIDLLKKLDASKTILESVNRRFIVLATELKRTPVFMDSNEELYKYIHASICMPLHTLACVEQAYHAPDIESFLKSDKYVLSHELLLQLRGLTFFDFLSSNLSDGTKISFMTESING